MTRAEILALRDAAKAAYTRALDAAQYSVQSGGASRSVTRHKLDELYAHYELWQTRLDEYDGLRRRVKFLVPLH